MENRWQIDDTTKKVYNYLNQKDEQGRLINRSFNNNEEDFVRNVKPLLKKYNLDGNNFFEILKAFDKRLLSEKNDGAYGELSEEDVWEILIWLYVQRYNIGHADDKNEEGLFGEVLQDFISDKYDSGVHFFEEILQNMDDAIGRATKKKDIAGDNDTENNINRNEIEIRWNDREIIFTYPDRGFGFYDLVAITSIGNSSKKGNLEEESIGEKGIGFKSIFAVAKKVNIKSRFFEFDIEYDETRLASVLQPSRISSETTGEKKTQLTLSFFDKFAIDGENGFKHMLREWLFENRKEEYLHFSPFLFLKHIESVVYDDGQGIEERITIQRKKGFLGTVLSLVTINNCNYLNYREELEFKKDLILDRWGKKVKIDDRPDDFYIKRPIEVMFPVSEEELQRNAKKGLLFSYLPTEMDVDVPLYINVDVHLKSSRGRISESDFKEGSKWNAYVKEQLTGVLCRAFEQVKNIYLENREAKYIKEIAEQLYIYMGEQTTKHFFADKLVEFYNKIIKENNYLNINKEFVGAKDIWLPSLNNSNGKQEWNEWNDMIEFCLHKRLPGEGGEQYSFSFSWYEYCSILRKNGKQREFKFDPKWRFFLLEKWGGIKKFYEESPLEIPEKNRIMLDMLTGLKSGNKEEMKRLDVLFVEAEMTENGYEITNIEKKSREGKEVFFRNTKEEISETEQGDYYVYIKNIFKSEKEYDDYKLCISGFIAVKDLEVFLTNLLQTYEGDECSAVQCFEETKKYIPLIKDMKNVKVSPKLKAKFQNYVFRETVWQDYKLTGQIEYLKKIARYLENNENSEIGYKLWPIDNWEEDTKKIMQQYLIHLGVKIKPVLVTNGKGGIRFDKLTSLVMPSFEETESDANTLELKYSGGDEELKKYIVEWLNDENRLNENVFRNIACFTEWDKKKKLKEVCVQIFGKEFFDKFVAVPRELLQGGYNIVLQLTGPQGGTSGYDALYLPISGFENISKEDSKVFYKENRLTINSGEYFFIDKEKYVLFYEICEDMEQTLPEKVYEKAAVYQENQQKCIANIRNTPCVKKIINGTGSLETLDILRWIYIWNNVFHVEYKYLEKYVFSIENFLSCHHYLVLPHINDLFELGYTIAWPEKDELNVVNFESMDYISNEFPELLKKEDYSRYCYCLTDADKEQIVYLNDSSKYTKLKNRDKDYIICIDKASKRPKTDYLCAILQTKLVIVKRTELKKKLEEEPWNERIRAELDKLEQQKYQLYAHGLLKQEQILDLQEILGEIEDSKNKKIIGLQSARALFAEAFFRDEDNKKLYDTYLSRAKECLPSIWKKCSGNKREGWGIKEWLCESYSANVDEDFEKELPIFQGYGYQCPICGSIARHQSLSGMSFIRRVKNADVNSNEQVPYLHFVSCLNCREMIEGASKVKILGEDNGSLLEIIKHFEEVCYCADNNHFRNHSAMKTVKLLLEIDEHEFELEMKLSYLHLALLSKMWKK